MPVIECSFSLPAGRHGVAGSGLGFLDVGEDLLAAQQVALAGLGEGDATSGTVEQAGAQVRLEVGHRPRNIGRWWC